MLCSSTLEENLHLKFSGMRQAVDLVAHRNSRRVVSVLPWWLILFGHESLCSWEDLCDEGGGEEDATNAMLRGELPRGRSLVRAHRTIRAGDGKDARSHAQRYMLFFWSRGRPVPEAELFADSHLMSEIQWY